MADADSDSEDGIDMLADIRDGGSSEAGGRRLILHRSDGLMDFIEAIGKKRKPLVTGEDEIEAMRITRDALESIKKRQVVEMDKFKGN